MSETNAPGPWAWQYFGDELVLVGPHGHRPVYLASQFTEYGSSLVTRGNDGLFIDLNWEHPVARLIAAAPDLLEACKGAAAYIEQQMRMDFDYMPEVGVANVLADSPTLNQLRAAIAKATEATND